MVSILLDLAPGLKRDGNVLRQMSEKGLLRELRTASESGAEYERIRLTAKSRLWLTDYLMLSDEKADYFMTALQAAYGLEVTPPKPSEPTPKPSAPPPKPVKQTDPPQGIKPSKGITSAQSGRDGNLTWTVDGNGNLTISGAGDMNIYSYDAKSGKNNIPWRYYSERIVSVKISNGVTSIGDNAFRHCGRLSNVNLPDSVTSIGKYAFSWCPKLFSIRIPERTAFHADAFDWHTTVIRKKTPLKSMPQASKAAIIDSGRTGECRWTMDRNDVFTVSGQGRMGTYSIGVRPPWWDYKEHMKVAIIERGVTSIGDGTFEGCAALKSVMIPDSVTSIKDNAFSGCVGLTRMIIPNSVTSIESWAFSGCSGLTSVLIPHSVTSIKCWVFAGCVGLKSVNIPNGVTEIKSYAFAGCAGLNVVTIPDSVTSIKHWAFDGCDSLNQVSVSGRAAIDPDAFPPHTRITRR